MKAVRAVVKFYLVEATLSNMEADILYEFQTDFIGSSWTRNKHLTLFNLFEELKQIFDSELYQILLREYDELPRELIE